MDYYLGQSIEIGEFGVAHVWFQCYEKGYFEKCPKHYFKDIKSNNPNPNRRDEGRAGEKKMR